MDTAFRTRLSKWLPHTGLLGTFRSLTVNKRYNGESDDLLPEPWGDLKDVFSAEDLHMLFPNADDPGRDLDHLDESWSNIQEWADLSLNLPASNEETIANAIDTQMEIVGAKDCCYGAASGSPSLFFCLSHRDNFQFPVVGPYHTSIIFNSLTDFNLADLQCSNQTGREHATNFRNNQLQRRPELRRTTAFRILYAQVC